MRRGRRVRAEEHVSHERWLVSYADFITLLFAFFVVLFASAFRDNHAIVTVSHAIHQGFDKMGAFTGENVIVYSLAPAEPGATGERKPSAGTSATRTVTSPDLVQLQKQLQTAMGAELKSHEVELRVTPEGFVISLKELGFFASGQAALMPGAAEKVKRIAAVIKQHNLELRVEGHSDNQPIHNAQFRSNWDLSTARAMSVLQLLVEGAGFDPERVSVAGYGQYHPLADNGTADGRRMNRRVDLVVLGAAPGQVFGGEAGHGGGGK